MKKSLVLMDFALIFNALQAQVTPGARPFLIGETLELRSTMLSENRPGHEPAKTGE